MIHLRKLPTPPCSSLDSGVIRGSRVTKFHYRAFSSNYVTKRLLELLNFIDFSVFRGSRTILTLRSSIIRWYYKYSKFSCKWLTPNKEMEKSQKWTNICITKITSYVSFGNRNDTTHAKTLKQKHFSMVCSTFLLILNISWLHHTYCKNVFPPS